MFSFFLYANQINGASTIINKIMKVNDDINRSEWRFVSRSGALGHGTIEYRSVTSVAHCSFGYRKMHTVHLDTVQMLIGRSLGVKLQRIQHTCTECTDSTLVLPSYYDTTVRVWRVQNYLYVALNCTIWKVSATFSAFIQFFFFSFFVYPNINSSLH